MQEKKTGRTTMVLLRVTAECLAVHSMIMRSKSIMLARFLFDECLVNHGSMNMSLPLTTQQPGLADGLRTLRRNGDM